MKQNSMQSRVKRNLVLSMLPGDIKDEALEMCAEVRRQKDATDPEAARKKIIDSFASINVNVASLKSYIGTDINQCSPAQLDDLRKLYAGIRNGDTTWAEIVAGLETAAAQKADPSSKAAEAVKAKLAGGAA